MARDRLTWDEIRPLVVAIGSIGDRGLRRAITPRIMRVLRENAPPSYDEEQTRERWAEMEAHCRLNERY
jgi:hypothetical protein